MGHDTGFFGDFQLWRYQQYGSAGFAEGEVARGRPDHSSGSEAGFGGDV